MYRTMCLALVVGVTALGSADAQYPRGRTVYHPPAPHVAPPGQPYYVAPDGRLYAMPVADPHPVLPASTVDPCCPCPPGTGKCKDNCHPPRITHKPQNCPPTQTCTPIAVNITKGPEPECVDIPFYGKPVAAKHKVKVPVRTIQCEEVIRFMDYKIDLKCCEITVCVPCERCVVKRETCVEQEREVAIEAYRRRDMTIDVYALNVPGLPDKFVLNLKMSETDFKTAYPGVPVPTYP